jgi:predicted restriction endonuclease
MPCANPACDKAVSFLPSQRGAGRSGARHVNGKVYEYSERVYCSRACKDAGQSIVMTGRRPSNGVYVNSGTFRSMIRREFYDRCSLCGWDKLPCDVAHILSREDGGDDSLENVTMLCPTHHREYDGGLIPIEEIRAARENVLKHQPSSP